MEPKRINQYLNPFPGLRSFSSGDSHLFFGRDMESDDLIIKLLKNRYVSLLGSSGSGKSSLINAGVIPKLIGTDTTKSSAWRVISLRPGRDPFENLTGAITKTINDSGQDINRSIISTELWNSGDLAGLTGQYFHDGEKVLLFIDQLEELFIHLSSDVLHDSAQKFIDILVNSVRKTESNMMIMTAMRSEALGECSHYWDLSRIVNNSNYIIPEPDTETWKTMIEGPVKYAGAKIDPELVEILLMDIRNRNCKLSVFQHAMMRTWEQWQKIEKSDKIINRSHYNAAGTVINSIQIHADQLYEHLGQRQKMICEVLFRTITKKGSDNKALKHPADLKLIKSIAGCTDAELYEVIDVFRGSSQSFINSCEDITLNENSVIDLQNECLISKWDRLKDWTDSESVSRNTYQRLAEAAELFQQGKTGLYKPPELLQALKWRDQNKPVLSWAEQINPAFERTMVYLRTSERAYSEAEDNRSRQEKRSKERAGYIKMVLGIVTVLAFGIIFFSYFQKVKAEKNIMQAELLRRNAIKEKARSDSTAKVAILQKMLSDSSASAAVKREQEISEQKIVAEERRLLAERNEEKVLSEKKKVVEQSADIQRLRMLSIGKTMSLKSLQMSGQQDLQTLLAYQAYLFNKMNNGFENDADIYAGLYNVALQYGSLSCKSFKGHNGEIKSVAFVPGKNEFFTSGNDGQVLKWSLDKKDETLQVIYSGKDIIEVLAVSPDASWLACGSASSSIRMIPLKGNNLSYELTGHGAAVKSLIFSYDGKYLYSAALDGKVLKWDIAARTSINVSTGTMEISSLDISSKGNYLAGISSDGNVMVWNPESSSHNFRIETSGRNIKVIRFNPDNNVLAIGDDQGILELWDIENQKKLLTAKAHDSTINDIRFNPGMNQMATAGNDKKIKIYNIKNLPDLSEPPITLGNNDGFILVMQFSPDGQMIISGESGGENNLIARPTHAEYLVRDICKLVSRNLTQEEWNIYVAKDIPLGKTCLGSGVNIKMEPITPGSK